jgi:signal transduction histidine kinase
MDLHAESKHEELDITNLLSEIADEFRPQADAKRQSLTLKITGPNAGVQGDSLQLRQALRNLIGNAIKYTPDGGMITVSLVQVANSINIEVKDTGYGIPASDLPHIFDRFYRVRNNGHDDIEGNGLGLAIVKSIVEQHYGNIDVDSEPGKGSCFHLNLPLFEMKSVRSFTL